MKKILMTGVTGFIGRNIYPLLKNKYDINAPTRQELDLRDMKAVDAYLRGGKFDALLHLANPNPAKRPAHDHASDMLRDSLDVFLNLTRCEDLYGKMIYAGSGAEFDKRLDISLIHEEAFGRSIPAEIYGYSKYIMNEISRRSKNIYNMRVFACYGPTDHESKFITHCMDCCQRNVPITIRQNCMFDYIHVFDLAKVAAFMIDSELQYMDYNVCTGIRFSLEQIAQEVQKQMGSNLGIEILSKGWNKEYTGNCGRLAAEFKGALDFIPLTAGIQMQINDAREKRL
jgi:GDP-L-fucose synthase